jgi:hypothetical protein
MILMGTLAPLAPVGRLPLADREALQNTCQMIISISSHDFITIKIKMRINLNYP